MATVEVSEIIERAKSAADKTNSNHVTQTEWLRWLNVDRMALESLIARSGYVLREGREDITANGALQYEFPDPLVVLGVYEVVDGRYRRLRHSDVMDGAGYLDTITTGPASTWRVFQSTDNELAIQLWPIPQSGAYKVYVIDIPATLTALDDEISYPAGMEEYLVLKLARRACAKEESPTTHIDKQLAQVVADIEAFCWDRLMGAHKTVRNVDRVERGWTSYPMFPSADEWYWA